MIEKNQRGLCGMQIRVPTFARYKRLASKLNQNSLTRALQFEVLESYPLLGEVLDFGGGESSQYRKLLGDIDYKSVNIDPRINPTWIVQVGESIPCDAESFDTVISMNTLEHVFNAQTVLSELHRVLRPGGELVLSTPFLFPIHGHPDDFFRPTPSWYRQALKECGFRECEIVPLFWGPFSVASTCSGLPGPAKVIRKHLALLIDLLYFQISRWRRPSTVAHAEFDRYASAFFVRAVK